MLVDMLTHRTIFKELIMKSIKADIWESTIIIVFFVEQHDWPRSQIIF